MATYKAGINLGGWISQYKEFNYKHFDTFITEEDIEIIAQAGFDHVRLPFDYPVIEDDDTPGVYKESGLKYIDQCITWAKKRGMGVILDLHHAPGYRFQDLQTNTLFEDRVQQKRFVDIWVYLTKRYMDEREFVTFELLNEIVEPDSSRWNKLMIETIAAIRAIDVTRYIYVGGNNYNSPEELKNLTFVEDEYVIYNFHFYNPFFLTHQKAYWSPSAMAYNKAVTYPGKYEGMTEFAKEYPEFAYFGELEGLELNKDLLRKDLQSAIAFREEKNCQLYCGEFGVIAFADLGSRINWHKDYVSLLKEYDIGGAVWSYKEMDFEIYDNEGAALDDSLIAVLVRK